MPSQSVNTQDAYRSYQIEKKLNEFIINGDINSFENWVKKAPTVRAGKVANDTIRQQKNIFIVSATLFSRSAIEAGMDVDESLQLSDYYIQQSEAEDSIEAISKLQFTMLTDYISKVNDIKKLGADHYLTKKVYHYILNNLSKPITTKDIADYLHLSRSYCSSYFKNETGKDLKGYIHQVKIQQAKQLLTQSNNTLISISTYLGYSSSSHFTKVFESIVGLSPSQYQKENRSL